MSNPLPPGPKGSWLPTWHLIREPRRTLEAWARRYGDPFLVHPLNGPVVITGRPDLIREIFGHDPTDYDPFATEALGPILGSGSMLVLGGEGHRRERKLVMPMFHGDRMRAYGQAMQDIAIEHVEHRLASGAVVPTLDLMTDVSLEVIVKTVLGSQRRERTDALMDASREVVKSIHPILFFSSKTHVPFLGLSPWDRFQASRRKLRVLLDAIYEERNQGELDGDDIFSMLMQARYEDGQAISRDHMREELSTFLFAGHETSAIAMTWAMYHLHSHRDVLTRLREELQALPDDRPGTLVSAPYLKAVVQETLRIHPIVTEVLRKLRSPMRLGEWTLPAGFAVAPATVLAHYNPETYPDPESFRPERFLERTYSPFEYMPFGGGHRRCIGAAFATYEMAIVLGTLLRRHSWELVDPKPVVPQRRNLTMGPSTRVLVRRI